MLRVITGTAKNTVLEVPSSARPMMDRVKTSIFDQLNFLINENVRVLDLYAGSGALGLECLSRGAKYSKFVEITKEGVRAIWHNAEKCKFDKAKYWVEKADALEFCFDTLHRNYKLKTDDEKEVYNLIFVCPPHIDTNDEILRLAGKLLEVNGLLVAECPSEKSLNQSIENLKFIELRQYGGTKIYFYTK